MDKQIGYERALTERQLALVEEIVVNGCSITEASVRAGYSAEKGRHVARVAGAKALSTNHVQAHFQQRLREELNNAAALAVQTLKRLNEAADSEHVQLNAATAILDRTGFTREYTQQQDRSIKVNINLS